MKIQIVTDVVTRRAGGVFDAVRDMFTNKAFTDHDVEILSYEDDMIEEDLPSWKGLPMRLFKPHFFLYSNALKEALMNSSADIYHQQGLWRYSHLLMEKYKNVVRSKAGRMFILGADKEEKIYKMMTFAGRSDDVADPWYSGDFRTTYNDIDEACRGLLKYLKERNEI